MVVIKLLYKPFAIMAGLISARLGRSVFRSIWAKIDDKPPPRPGSGEGGTLKVIGGQALQAAVMAGVAAGVNRTFARAFHHLIGPWPEEPSEPAAAES
jgi:hypothetical protein